MRVPRRIGQIAIALALSCGASACGGDSGGSDAGDTTFIDEAQLSTSSLCEDWSRAAGAQQRTLAEEYAAEEGIDVTVADFVTHVDAWCSDNKALTIDEAIEAAVAAEATETADPYAETRLSGQIAKEIQRSIRESWNRCGPKDVCVEGEYAYAVGCRQPDPQVRKLSCFVTTERGRGGQGYGYGVSATVSADETSFTWRLGE